MPAALHEPRRHDIDALRAIAFGLLILYHVGMFYVPWHWHVQSAYPAAWLEPVMVFFNQWRMPLIFLVSGLAVHFMRRGRSASMLARQRLKRLGLPLFFGMLVVVPPQAYVEALRNQAFEGDYLAFLSRYLQLRPWPAGSFAGAENGVTWNHLWYLPYLLLYTLVIIPLAPQLDRLSERFVQLRGTALVLVPLLPFMAAGLWVYPQFPYISHSLIDDGYAHAMFGCCFIYGYLIGRDRALWAHLAALRGWLLGLGVLSFAMRSLFARWLDTEASGSEGLAWLFSVYLNRWTWMLVMLAWAHHLLNRPMRWLGWANESVYPWYVLHQSLTVVIGYYAGRALLGPVVEPIVVLGGTLLGCWVLTSVIQRSRWLRPLFGLKPGPNATSRRQPEAATGSS